MTITGSLYFIGDNHPQSAIWVFGNSLLSDVIILKLFRQDLIFLLKLIYKNYEKIITNTRTIIYNDTNIMYC